jgi:spore coat protein U-like protein
MKTFKFAVLASSLVASGFVMAAEQGTLGLTSEGESIVTIIKQNAVQITDVADLDLGTQAFLTADATDNDDVCVFNSTASYQITVSSANGLNLMDGAEAIPYSVEWSANGGAAVTVVDGDPITGLVGDQTSLDCNGGTNANFSATVVAADFNAAAPGTYTDTLTLLVEPE